MSRARVVILGAGPAGLGAAIGALSRGFSDVTVLEAADAPGGLCRSVRHAGVDFDLGSHRLHPASRGEVLSLVQRLLGGDLLKRPRNGRILLGGRFVAFPPKPLDLVRNLPPGVTAQLLGELAMRPFRRPPGNPADFAAAVEAGLGKTLARGFYIPYAKKIWGLDASEISAEQARRRVSAQSPAALVLKMLSRGMRFSGSLEGIFYYPRGGFGRIPDAMAREVDLMGGRIVRGARAAGLQARAGGGLDVSCEGEAGGSFPADIVLSSLAIERLIPILRPSVPDPVAECAAGLRRRDMTFLLAGLARPAYTAFDAHYLPGPETEFTRLSEPPNYAGAPHGSTGLCFEFPCDPGEVRDSPDLCSAACSGLRAAGLPDPGRLDAVTAAGEDAYPVYDMGFRRRLDAVEQELERWPLLSMGRQGLFAHDNFHHAVISGLEAARCVREDGTPDRARWAGCREGFRSQAVVD
jgi:protoporphyrinogen oxidase